MFPGLHPPIITLEQFEAAAQRLKSKAVERGTRVTRAAKGVLTGKLFDHTGQPLSPTFSYGRGRTPYRYYVAVDLQTGKARTLADGAVRRVSAPAVETFLVDLLRRLSGNSQVDVEALRTLIRRVELRASETHVVVDAQALLANEHPDLLLGVIRRRLGGDEQAVQETAVAGRIRVVIPHRLQLRGGGKWLFGAAETGRRKINPNLIDALRRAHADLAELNASPLAPSASFDAAQAPPTQHGRQMARMALMAPDLQRQILSGEQPQSLKLRAILKGEMPLAWADQPAWLMSIAEK